MEISMQISEFLAKLIGLYLVIFGLLVIFRKRQIAATAKELVASKSALAISGEISLIFGLVIAIDHTVWEYSWRGLVTLLGYIMIARGIVRFAFPVAIKKALSKMTEQTWWLISVVMILVGAYLTYCGFAY